MTENQFKTFCSENYMLCQRHYNIFSHRLLPHKKYEETLWNLFLEYHLVEEGKLKWDNVENAIEHSQYYNEGKNETAQDAIIKSWNAVFHYFEGITKETPTGTMTEIEFKEACEQTKTINLCEFIYDGLHVFLPDVQPEE